MKPNAIALTPIKGYWLSPKSVWIVSKWGLAISFTEFLNHPPIDHPRSFI